MLDVRSGVARELVARNGTRHQTLMLASYPTVCDGGVNVGVHISNRIAMMTRQVILMVVPWALLSVIVFDHYSLVRSQVPMRILF